VMTYYRTTRTAFPEVIVDHAVRSLPSH
jgi:hypothetical protein